MCSLTCTRILMMLLLAWILVSTTAAAATSIRVLNFIDVISQDFDNGWQIEVDEQYKRPRHNHIRLLFKPAKVPALSSNNTILHVELLDNQVKRQEIMVVTEDTDKTIRRLRYNITNTDKFSVDSVDSIDLSGLQNLTPEELVERKECEATFSEIESNVFFGLFPDCRDQRNGIIPKYQAVITCNALSAFTSVDSLERYNAVPYIMKSKKRFPKLPEMLIGVPNYASPCPRN